MTGMEHAIGQAAQALYAPDPDPCVMRPGQPHVCLRPDHDERHGKTTPKQPA